MIRHFVFAAGLVLLPAFAACTPQTTALMALVPDGTVSVLASHLEGVSDGNRQRLAEFERRGDWNGLARFAEENLAADRSNADWWTVAGYAYSRLGKYPRAIECYSEVVRLAPDETTGWNLLAQAWRASGQPQRAIATLNNALLIRNDASATFYLLGESYSDIGRLRPAVDAYQQALKLNPEFALAWFGMGRAYVRQGRHADAADIVKALEKLDPRLAAELSKLLPKDFVGVNPDKILK
jgi:tetratricopeptide (TPR) repeat protein